MNSNFSFTKNEMYLDYPFHRVSPRVDLRVAEELKTQDLRKLEYFKENSKYA